MKSMRVIPSTSSSPSSASLPSTSSPSLSITTIDISSTPDSSLALAEIVGSPARIVPDGVIEVIVGATLSTTRVNVQECSVVPPSLIATTLSLCVPGVKLSATLIRPSAICAEGTERSGLSLIPNLTVTTSDCSSVTTAEMVTQLSPLTSPEGAASEITGGVVSFGTFTMKTTDVCAVLPLLSVTSTATVCSPSANASAGVYENRFPSTTGVASTPSTVNIVTVNSPAPENSPLMSGFPCSNVCPEAGD